MIESKNKKNDKIYRKAKKEHDEKIAKGVNSNPPPLKQESLQMSCCCIQVGVSFYSGIQCGICTDGTCEICLCSCSFVCKLGQDYDYVLAERMDSANPTPDPAAFDNAKVYLNNALTVKTSALQSAKSMYKTLQEEGKLSQNCDTKGLNRAISRTTSLATSNFMTHNPPGHGARQQLKAKAQILNHPKGATWISECGRDRNLAGTGAERRVKNNCLQGVSELSIMEDNRDAVMDVWNARPVQEKMPDDKRAWRNSRSPSTSSIDIRIRKRANKIFHNKATTPVSKRRAARVRDGILNNDQRMESAIEDCEPPNSQDAYEICEEVVRSPP